LDHADVVGTVTYGQQDRVLILFHQLHDKRFLQGRNTTCPKSPLAIAIMLRDGERTTDNGLAEKG